MYYGRKNYNIKIFLGDLSDISEVIDSSDDPAYVQKKARRRARAREFPPVSTSSSSELDYSYQTKKKRMTAGADLEIIMRPSRSRDIEKQRMLDEVSMQIFNIGESTDDESGMSTEYDYYSSDEY